MRILKGLASRWGIGGTVRRIALLTVCQTRKWGIGWPRHLGNAFCGDVPKSPFITGRCDRYRRTVSLSSGDGCLFAVPDKIAHIGKLHALARGALFAMEQANRRPTFSTNQPPHEPRSVSQDKGKSGRDGMRRFSRRSVLRGSIGLAAAGTLARPFIANVAAKTASIWWTHGFVPGAISSK